MIYRHFQISAKIAERFIPKVSEIYRCSYSTTTTISTESERLQSLEQKVKNDAASKPINWDTSKPYTEIPGPKPLPLIGNLWRFLPVIGEFYEKNQVEIQLEMKKYGDIATMRGVLSQDLVFLFNPDDYESVYRNEGIWPERTVLKCMAYYQQKIRKDIFKDLYSVGTTNGKEWYKTRKLANPIMNQTRSVEIYMPELNRVTDDFLKRIRYLINYKEQGQLPDNFLNELNKWSLESVSFVALDKRLGSLRNDLDPNSETQTVINAIHEFFELMFRLEFQPSFWKYFNTKDWKKFVYNFNIVTDIFHKHIREAKSRFEATSDPNRKSMLENFLDVDENFAVVMALDLLTAGVDTTSKTAGSTLYFLATHKRAQDELRKELRTILPHKNSPLTKETLQNAHYLKATIKEGLRMGGIAVANVRTLTKDMVIGGYQIPKGTMVQMCTYPHLFSEDHFPKPWEFMPERWFRSNTTETSFKNAHRFVYLPFGFGPRSCIGQKLATMELELLIAKLIRNFEIDWPHPPAKFISRLFYEIGDPLKYVVKEVPE